MLILQLVTQKTMEHKQYYSVNVEETKAPHNLISIM